MEGKKNPEINIKDITIKIEIIDNSTDKCTLLISYNGTEKYGDQERNGSLSYWKNELKVFGGDLYYNTRTKWIF